MKLNEEINRFDYKYQFVKNNRYWNYDKEYELLLDNKKIKISESDILLRISYDISNKVYLNSVKRNDMADYEIPNIDIEQMKKIVISFFMSINPNLSNKISFILANTKFIRYDDNISGNKQRSVSNGDGIKLYYKNDLKSLVTLAHEVSHRISNLDDNLEINNKNKVTSFAEIESELTEDLFLDYLKENNLQIKDKNLSGSVRPLNNNDVNDIKYNKYKSAIFMAYRSIDELEFKKIAKNSKIYSIDNKLINELSNNLNLEKEEIISRIDKFISQYYPDDEEHNYLGVKDYDLKNGKQLSNECRFIYAYCFVEKFNNMNLDYSQKCNFYKNYLDNAKNMSFQKVLELFNVNLFRLDGFTNEFINKFNELSNKNYLQSYISQLNIETEKTK